LWGRTAEIAGEYLAKGRPVLIEGRLQLDTWDDRETGQKRSKLRVVGENMTMLGSKGDNAGGGGGGGNYGGRGASGGSTRGQGAPSEPEPQESADFGSGFDDGPAAAQGDDIPF
jgi:single-strand DNA-binding protein